MYSALVYSNARAGLFLSLSLFYIKNLQDDSFFHTTSESKRCSFNSERKQFHLVLSIFVCCNCLTRLRCWDDDQIIYYSYRNFPAVIGNISMELSGSNEKQLRQTSCNIKNTFNNVFKQLIVRLKGKAMDGREFLSLSAKWLLNPGAKWFPSFSIGLSVWLSDNDWRTDLTEVNN